MEFIFLNPAGTVLFSRSDAEDAHWLPHEYSMSAMFPFDPAKKIERGMRIAFRDPVTDTIEMFEVRDVTMPDAEQNIQAEHIAVSELSDEHINTTKITEKTAAEALTTALTGTLWAVGTNTATGTQNADFPRGSVWQAVGTIQQNWNVYITPRVVISAAGVITGRYLDIAPAGGTFRGLRLSVRKDMTDPCVQINDEDLYTALVGYGGSVDKAQQSGDDQPVELTFADEVWTATADHPAKPSGQTYLEWPEKTAAYGRNGRPRFGYYQNGAVKDPALLLELTWQALKKAAAPKISITGTVTDLARMGMPDVPLRWHDKAIVEIEDIGETYDKEIIQLDVDLLDESNNRPQIGEYIPNIIYINRDTAKRAGGGGGGGRHGDDNAEDEQLRFETEFIRTQQMIGMVAGIKDGSAYVKAAQIVASINNDGTTEALIDADHINISATDTAYTLAGDLEHDADGKLVIKNAAGLYVQRNQALLGVWDRGNLTGGVMVQQINGQSSVKISGDVIDINGSNISISADRIDINGVVSKLLTEQIACVSIHTTGGSNLFDGRSDMDELHISNDLIMGDNVLTYAGNTVTWKTATNWSFTFSQVHNFVYRSGGQDYTTSGYIVGTKSSSTIHYLGY